MRVRITANIKLLYTGKRKSVYCSKICPHIEKYDMAIMKYRDCSLTESKVELSEDRPYYKRNRKCLRFKKV